MEAVAEKPFFDLDPGWGKPQLSIFPDEQSVKSIREKERPNE
jgi:hypothetical protein